MRHLAIVLALLPAVVAEAGTSAEKPYKEDLSAVKLPHGEVVLPDRNDPKARQGYILRFSDRKLNVLPFKRDERPTTIAGFFQRLREAKTGDLIYSHVEKGSLLAVSGRMADLGGKALHDVSGRELAPPPVIYGVKSRSGAGERTPGAIEGAPEGHCYLVETAGGKYALVRLVQKRGREALIQYVYQPDGSRAFDIPRGKRIAVAPWRPAGTRPARPLPPPSVPGKVTDLRSLLAAREKMIAKLIATVRKDPPTREETSAKLGAIRGLGYLRAIKAVGALVDNIDFPDRMTMRKEASFETLFPSTWALRQIGKPSSLAALKAIGACRLDAASPKGEEPENAMLRLKLLVMVVEGVEGPEVAEFMIQARTKKAPVAARPAFEAALRELKQH